MDDALQFLWRRHPAGPSRKDKAMPKSCRLLLADDHDIVLAGLRLVLDHPDFEIVGAVKDGRALVKAARELRPDVMVVDITMPQLNGIDAARIIHKRYPKIKTVFLTMHRDLGYASEALDLPYSAYVLKSSAADDLPTAIREVLKGHSFLSPALEEALNKARELRTRDRRAGAPVLTARQREILQLLAEGRSIKEIAFDLQLSPRTVEFHKYRIMQELGVRSVAELVRSALSLKLIA
jgi:DNA-binding NarL/FixJ family response regulator